MTACISHDDIITTFQFVSHTRPAQPIVCEAVQQEDGRLVTAVAAVIMVGDAIGIHLAFKPLCHVVFLSFLGCISGLLQVAKERSEAVSLRDSSQPAGTWLDRARLCLSIDRDEAHIQAITRDPLEAV